MTASRVPGEDSRASLKVVRVTLWPAASMMLPDSPGQPNLMSVAASPCWIAGIRLTIENSATTRMYGSSAMVIRPAVRLFGSAGVWASRSRLDSGSPCISREIRSRASAEPVGFQNRISTTPAAMPSRDAMTSVSSTDTYVEVTHLATENTPPMTSAAGQTSFRPLRPSISSSIRNGTMKARMAVWRPTKAPIRL
ncbi:hypothetical protein SDC9_117977 [bioreactor metagenome]|uniref:Uncharacterized protein n=1 Tax=bioreactor metagenome TaxID=1076179 RepID=A0A645C8N7_9ZZZZ